MTTEQLDNWFSYPQLSPVPYSAACRLQLYRLVPLTHGKWASVDAVDFERVIRHKWYARKMGKTFYALSHLQGSRTGLKMRLHSIIQSGMVDHRDLNGLNCRRYNLREATKAQNGANRGKNRNNTSGYKGVVRHARGNWWMARLIVNRRGIYLGIRKTPEEAARLYDAGAIKHFGEFARLNFPLERSAYK